MTWRHHGFAAPLFDPTNFDFVFQGRADELFAELAKERGFERERDRLVCEGILKIGPKTVRLASPGAEAVTSHAIWSRASKAKDWLENDPATAGDPLYEALSLIGVRRARDIAEALLAYGDNGYLMASGPLRDVLSQIANDGDLDVFVHALNVAMLHPGADLRLVISLPGAQLVSRCNRGIIVDPLSVNCAHPDAVGGGFPLRRAERGVIALAAGRGGGDMGGDPDHRHATCAIR